LVQRLENSSLRNHMGNNLKQNAIEPEPSLRSVKVTLLFSGAESKADMRAAVEKLL